MILYYECIENVRAHIERIVRLEVSKDIRPLILDDLPSKKHSCCFASDHAGTDHALLDVEIIFRTEVLLDHDTHPLVPGHHDIAHAAALLSNVHAVLVHGLRHREKSVPAVHVSSVGIGCFFLEQLIETARKNAVQYRLEFAVFRLIKMRQEHRL